MSSIRTFIQNSDTIIQKIQYVRQNIKDEVFSDPEFPSDLSSITKRPNSFQQGASCVWRRARQFSGTIQSEIKIFQGIIQPADIQQGQLGDCYFLSSLSSLAERPTLIQRLFETREYNSKGEYLVWLCHDGEWKLIRVDDKFPCKSAKHGPIFSRGHGPQLWVMLLQQCYAKIFGCYDRIEEGFTGDALRDLTGAPFEYVIINRDKAFSWVVIVDSIKNQFLLTAGSNYAAINSEKEQGETIGSHQGIIEGHAYAILDAREINGGKDRLVQLRNPWGEFEWNGDWSDNSPLWTEELKKELNWTNQDDGVFWMKFEDFCSEFRDLSVNYLHEDYVYCSKSIDTQGKKNLVVNFESKTQTHAFISVLQIDERNFVKIPGIKYQYSPIRIIIYQLKNDGQIEVLAGKFQFFGREVFLEIDLPAFSQFSCLIEIDWCQNISNQLTISSYSNQFVQFDNDITYFDEKGSFAQSISKHSLQLQKFKILDWFELNREIVKQQSICDATYDKLVYQQCYQVFRITGQFAGILFIYFRNNSIDQDFIQTINLNDLENLDHWDSSNLSYQSEVEKSQIESNQISVELKSDSDIKEKIVLFKLNPAGKGFYKFRFQKSTKFVSNEKGVINYIKANCQNQKERCIGGVGTGVFFYSIFLKGILYVYYCNESENNFYERLTIQSKNLAGIDHYENLDQEIEVSLSKTDREKLIQCRQVDPQKSTSYQFKYVIKLVKKE